MEPKKKDLENQIAQQKLMIDAQRQEIDQLRRTLTAIHELCEHADPQPPLIRERDADLYVKYPREAARIYSLKRDRSEIHVERAALRAQLDEVTQERNELCAQLQTAHNTGAEPKNPPIP